MTRVAIVGAGVQGICLLEAVRRRFPEADAVVFDAHSDVGGVWNNTGHVPYMSVQMASRHYMFPDFAHALPQDMMSHRAVQSYIRRYCEHKNLMPFMRLGHRVTKVEATSSSTYRISCRGFRDEDDFDVVMMTGHSSMPRLPDAFVHINDDPRIVHSSRLTQNFIRKMRGSRCLVVGGSKSAAEAVHMAKSQQPDCHCTWVARRFSSFAPFQPGTTMPVGVNLLRAVPGLVMGSIDGAFPLRVRDDMPLRAGTANFLTEEQYSSVRSCDEIVIGEVESVDTTTKHSVQVNIVKQGGGGGGGGSGSGELSFDLVVLATGYDNSSPSNPDSVINDPEHPHAFFVERSRFPLFGIIQSHFAAESAMDYLASKTSKDYDAFCDQWIMRSSPRLLTYQVRYLLSSNKMEVFGDSSLLPSIAIVSAICVCLVSVFALVAQLIRRLRRNRLRRHKRRSYRS